MGSTCKLLTTTTGKKALESDLSLHIHLQQRSLRVAIRLIMPKGNLPTFLRYHLSSAPGLGAQTYIRCYQYRQSLHYVQKHFVLLALRKTEDLGSWRLNSLCSKVNRTVAARTLGWGHEVRKGLDYLHLEEMERCATSGLWNPRKRSEGLNLLISPSPDQSGWTGLGGWLHCWGPLCPVVSQPQTGKHPKPSVLRSDTPCQPFSTLILFLH